MEVFLIWWSLYQVTEDAFLDLELWWTLEYLCWAYHCQDWMVEWLHFWQDADQAQILCQVAVLLPRVLSHSWFSLMLPLLCISWPHQVQVVTFAFSSSPSCSSLLAASWTVPSPLHHYLLSWAGDQSPPSRVWCLMWAVGWQCIGAQWLVLACCWLVLIAAFLAVIDLDLALWPNLRWMGRPRIVVVG